MLLILSQDVLDRARVLAGKATTTLKLPVSLQIVLRALIDEGLKREDHPVLLANMEGKARAVRVTRTQARRGGPEAAQRAQRARASRAQGERKPRRERT